MMTLSSFLKDLSRRILPLLPSLPLESDNDSPQSLAILSLSVRTKRFFASAFLAVSSSSSGLVLRSRLFKATRRVKIDSSVLSTRLLFCPGRDAPHLRATGLAGPDAGPTHDDRVGIRQYFLPKTGCLLFHLCLFPRDPLYSFDHARDNRVFSRSFPCPSDVVLYFEQSLLRRTLPASR